MKFLITDYSEVYYRTIAQSAVPAQRGGKFIQIVSVMIDTEYLVLSPRELSPYHAHIVERFCLLHGIAGAYDKKREFFAIHDDAWEVIGGGKWYIDETLKTISLFDDSGMYGKFDHSGLKEKMQSVDWLREYTVIIDGE